MKPVDTHCHLDFEQFDDDRDEVIAECRERLAAVVTIGTGPDTNDAALELAREHDHIHATHGLHPAYVEDHSADDVDTVAAQIEERRERIRAVGEIGLDYHHVRDDHGRETQRQRFRRMLTVAEEVGLPAVLHTRDAEQDAFDIAQEFSPPAVVQHCFNGRPGLAREAVDADHYIAVSTQVLHSARVRDIAAAVPLDRILLETDAPFLYRDGRNVPWHVEESAEAIADIKDVAVDEVMATTTRNAADAFGLPL